MPTDIEISQAINLHSSRLYFFRKEGRVSVRAADQICCAFGVHLSFVYGDTYWDYLHERIAFDRARHRERMAKRRAKTKARQTQPAQELQQCA